MAKGKTQHVSDVRKPQSLEEKHAHSRMVGRNRAAASGPFTDNDAPAGPEGNNGQDFGPGVNVDQGDPVSVQLPGGAPRLDLSQNAQKIIVVSMTMAMVITLVERFDQIVKGNAAVSSVPQIVIGTFIAGSLLLGMSYFVPEFAGGLAVVVIVVAAFEKGKPFWDVVTTATGGNKSAGSTPSVPTAPVGSPVSPFGDVQPPMLAPLPSTPTVPSRSWNLIPSKGPQ
jgi:hypothetical protein